MNKRLKVLFAVVFTICFLILTAAVANRFFYSWTDHLKITGCLRKVGQSPGYLKETGKLDYFTKIKFSWGELLNGEFPGRIESDSRYTTVKVPARYGQGLEVRRNHDGGMYTIRFDYVWRQLSPDPKSTIYDGVGVSFEAASRCGTPPHVLERNLKTVIRELPVDEELRGEMLEKLTLEFSAESKAFNLF